MMNKFFISAVIFVVGAVFWTSDAQYIPSNVQQTTYGYRFTATGGPLGTSYPTIRGEVILAQADMIRLRIYPTSGPQPFIIPSEVFPQSQTPASMYRKPTGRVQYAVSISNGSASLDVSAFGRVVVSFDFANLILDSQICNLSFSYPQDSFVSGYGERNYNYFLNLNGNQTTTLSSWNTDNLTPWKNPMYGIYPVFFINNPLTSTYVSVLQMNSHAQQATINPFSSSINMIAIGGIVDFHVFVGPSAMDVMRSYQKYIGPAEVPPYWALGTHQCKYGYNTLQELEAVLEGYLAAEIPLQVLWNDIDYMHTFHIFTVDQERYAGLRNFTEVLRAGGRQYVQIIDPGVAVNELNYSVYQSGEQADVFMKRDNTTMVGVVWPGWTAFPDFTNPDTTQWWTSEIQKYFQFQVELDGMWTDMNEISSFCGGSCPIQPGTPWTFDWHTVDWNTFDQQICQKNGCNALNTSLNYPPFNPLTNGNQLFTKTVDMEADTYMGKYYDIKPFYGNMENMATHSALSSLNPNQRPFILTRSTFTGAGRSTFHWAGDNTATWGADTGGLLASIQSAQASNLGGVFMVGSDIPGFTGPNTTEHLADRWYQLGSYYTFMRNHRDLNGAPQEPYRFSPIAQSAFKEAIARRYRLLPYIFSNLAAGRLFGIPAIMHPSLVFSDQLALYEESVAMMIGLNLLIIPVVEEDSTTATARIPSGMWYWLSDLNTSSVSSFVSDGSVYSFDVPRYTAIPSFQRAGSMIPMHNEAKLLVQDTQATGYAMVFAMTSTVGGLAFGDLILDTPGSAPIPTNYQGVFSFSAQGSVSSGFITVSSTGSVVAPAQEESYVLLFPPSDANSPNGYTVSNISATIDGVACDESIQCYAHSPVPNKIVIRFTQGTSPSNSFQFRSLQWSATLTNLPPASDHSNDKWKKAFIATTATLGGLLVVVLGLALALYIRRRQTTIGYEYVDTSSPVNNENYGTESANGGVPHTRVSSNLSNRL